MSKHKIRPLSWNELVHKLRASGFDGPYQGGKHPFMIKGELVLTLPNPHPEDISVDLNSPDHPSGWHFKRGMAKRLNHRPGAHPMTLERGRSLPAGRNTRMPKWGQRVCLSPLHEKKSPKGLPLIHFFRFRKAAGMR